MTFDVQYSYTSVQLVTSDLHRSIQVRMCKPYPHWEGGWVFGKEADIHEQVSIETLLLTLYNILVSFLQFDAYHFLQFDA